jgi:L-iditol 2-dehydrogenase
MRQAIMTGAHTIDFREVSIPQAGDNDVLIEVKRIGICGSDIHVYHGKHKYMTFPVVQGHEGAGVVTKVGGKVAGLKAGDRVTVMPVVYCGRCRPCRDHKYNVCENVKILGVHATGMAADYFLVDAAKVYKIPDSISFDTGTMIEPLAVAIHAVKRSGGVSGANVLVLGAGPIGNLVAQAAKNLGAARTMITDVIPKRLEIAAACGIDYPVATSAADLKEAVLRHFGHDGADVIFDCAAVKATVAQATAIARKGTNIVIVGNFTEPVTIEMGLMQRREVSFLSVMLYLPEDFQEAIDLLAAGKIRTDELITNHFDFTGYLDAYRFIDSNARDVMKVIIDVAD